MPVIPTPPSYTSRAGAEYAQELAASAQRLSFRLLVLGWFLVGTAVLFALAGTTARTEFEVERTTGSAEEVVGNENPQGGVEVLRLRSGPKNWFYAHMGLIFGAFSIISAGVGWQCLDRSSAASLLAVAANDAIAHSNASSSSEKDWQAYKLCVAAKSDWLKGRINHDRINSISNALLGENFLTCPAPDAELLANSEGESNS